jgi:putative membrane-bound dehydrogenase-like protein
MGNYFKRFIKAILVLLLTFALADAGANPIRVLYLGQETTAASRHCHVLMRELGRDAIWFDYTTDPKVADAAWLKRFDAVLLDAPDGTFAALSSVAGARVVKVEFATEAAAWAEAGFVGGVKTKLLSAAGDTRRKEWETFLATRESEVRAPNPNVANYERRAEAVSLQQPFSVKGSRERTQVAPDLRLELFAGEPDIAKPIAFAWDERGRLWVCEARDYPHGINARGEGNDDIKICEDTDGDGRADKFTIFADKLNLPTSLVFVNGGVIVSQSPRFIFLKDTNGDDKADLREVVIEGWGISDTHAQANSLHWGHDNWIYGCVGYSGFRGTVGGKAIDFRQGTYRFSRDYQQLEFLHQFSNNSWGQGANEFGDQFGGTANNAPIFFGGIPARVVPKGMRAMTAKRINVEDKCHTITPNFRQVDVFGGYTAAAGSAFIHSGNLPPRLQGKALVCEPTMKVISLMDIQRAGAGYTAKDGFNLVASSDEWMSPVFAEVGPDGAVWFADWQNFIIQHNPTPSVERGGYRATTGVGGAHENPLRDHARGRVYRVVWDQARKPAVTSLKGAGAAELTAALGNDNLFWRLTAQRLLVEGKRLEAVPALKAAATNREPITAIHALWTLHGLGQLDDRTHLAALNSTHAAVRRNGVRALGNDAHAVSLFFGAGVVSDPDTLTRLDALVKIAEFPTTKEIQSMAASLARNPVLQGDEWLSDAVRILARRHKAEVYKEGPNLLPNAGFEVTGPDGLPEGWKRRDYGNRTANQNAEWRVVSADGQFHTGKQAVRIITRGDADTSLHADVALKPNTLYRLSGWVKTRALNGKASLNDHLGRQETDQIRSRESDWTEVEAVFNSGSRPTASINILHVARGDSYFDDVKLCEVIPADDEAKLTAGDSKRGSEIFFKHPAACILCHSVKGQGSTVGPALDGVATRKDAAYIRESLLDPSRVLAQGFEQLQVSPMPPMGDIFSPQELADIQAFVQTLK